MKRKCLAVGIILLFVGTCIIPAIAQDTEKPLPTSRGNWLYVGGSGPGNYTRIQDAINDATDGDTVFVYDDSSPYYELLVVEKSISLIGENRDTTIIDGDYQGNVIVIQSDNVTVNGFKIINCVMENQTKNVINISNSKNVVIKDNNISVGKNLMIYGIHGIGIFMENSSYNVIQNNVIYKEGEECVTEGLSIISNSNNNNVSENEIYGYSTGINIKYSNNNDFYSNNIHDNENGIIIYGIGNNIICNQINNNSHSGIRLSFCKYSLVYSNTVTYNGYSEYSDNGIYISHSSFFRIINNNISNNKEMGIFIYYPDIPSIGNIVSKNNLINNEKNAYIYKVLLPVFTTRWYNNYWSDAINNELFLKIIHGEVIIHTYFYSYSFKIINIDWHPAKEPYDIPGMS